MFNDLLQILRESWRNQPVVVVLSILAFCILVFVIVDTHLHRRKRKKLRQGRRNH